MNIEYREVTHTAELERIIDLEIRIWGLEDRDAVPSNVLLPIIHNGGLVLAAYDNNTPVGLSFAFPGRAKTLWSHITGVHPDYRNQGIGYQLKQEQRKWARQQNYQAIRWTYDPLQSRNAHFNFNVLGAKIAHLHPEFYGQMRDGINAGLPSHRLEVHWPVEPNHRTTQVTNTPEHSFLLSSSSGYEPELARIETFGSNINIEIPCDINELKHSDAPLARRWSEAVCAAFEQALAKSYTVSHVVTQSDRCWYVLSPPTPWYLYVVRCADDSLYTGITTDVTRRIDQHNTGKGAAYTASRRPVERVAAWVFPDQSSALRAELRFKRQSRLTKLTYINTGKPFAGGKTWKP